ncbi:unnamed protein product [Onchocerca flexuosa]|nr:unnamed protein product [Onchocerca flexuosa]
MRHRPSHLNGLHRTMSRNYHYNLCHKHIERRGHSRERKKSWRGKEEKETDITVIGKGGYDREHN